MDKKQKIENKINNKIIKIAKKRKLIVSITNLENGKTNIIKL
jgi:hypothetical protein